MGQVLMHRVAKAILEFYRCAKIAWEYLHVEAVTAGLGEYW